jgi:hypothetical protein
MTLTLYVRSLGGYHDNRRLWNGPRHNIACAADTTNLRVKGVEVRLYDPESRKVMDALACLPAALREQVEVVDIGQLAGRLKAWQNGIFQTPAAALDGETCTGPTQVLLAIEALAAG